jgi:hypothetical protein
VQTLADTYRDRIFRARRKAAHEKLHWHTLLLRFGENVYLLALGDGREWAEIYAPTGEQAKALYEEIARALAKQQPVGTPSFYMLRFDYSEFLTERVEHVPDDPGDEFLSLCYGSDILAWLEQFSERTTGRAGGLTILEGPPGTGKTSLVSLMIRRSWEVACVLRLADGSRQSALFTRVRAVLGEAKQASSRSRQSNRDRRCRTPALAAQR